MGRIFVMLQVKKMSKLLTIVALSGALLSACGSENNNASVTATPQQTEAANNSAQTKSTEAETKTVTDWSGHEVEIPTQPERVIYHGEVTGDVLALGVTPVGIIKRSGTPYDDQIEAVEDVGFPINVEKSMELAPDLIIFSNSDETQYEQLAKIAPTVTFNSFHPLDERMKTLGELLGKQAEAEAWLDSYYTKRDEMWSQLKGSVIGEGETASVFTMYPGNRLFVMAGAGLPQFLYEDGGFTPTPKVKELIDAQTGFVEISAEAIQEYAGDRIFILTPEDDAAKASTAELLKSQVWNSIAAVKNGYVYEFDIRKASGDALSREWMLEELPKALQAN